LEENIQIYAIKEIRCKICVRTRKEIISIIAQFLILMFITAQFLILMAITAKFLILMSIIAQFLILMSIIAQEIEQL
jgi:hypothetical protein